MATQTALGAINVVLLAPVWLQMAHLVGAEMFGILLVLASTDLLFRPSRHSILLKAICVGHRMTPASVPPLRDVNAYALSGGIDTVTCAGKSTGLDNPPRFSVLKP